MVPSFPARLHVLLARDAPRAVILRRGPARWVQQVLWHTDSDVFEPGQWLRGRVYERRCDVSPDGRLLVYFALNGAWLSESKGSWTAVSKVPWFTALAFWPDGSAWFGGGMFTERDVLHLNTGRTPAPDRAPPSSLRILPMPAGGVGGEDFSVYFPRLRRDGWVHLGMESASSTGRRDVWEKPAPSGRLWLRKTTVAELPSAPGRGCYYDEHALRPADGDAEVPLPGAEWADFDHRGRLVVARAGRLEVLDADRHPGRESGVLVDLNPHRPERLKAPDWARRW